MVSPPVPGEAGLTWERWVEIGQSLGSTVKNLPWAVGDWLVLGEDAFGERAAQHLQDVGMAVERLSNYAWVSRAFPPTTRVEGLTWTHHRYIAKLNEDERSFWLRRSLEENLSTGELWRLLHANKPTVTWRCPECRFVSERNEFKEVT